MAGTHGVLAFVLALVLVACDNGADLAPGTPTAGAPPVSTTAPGALSPAGLPVRTLTVTAAGGGSRQVTAEVVTTETQRGRGLMQRPSMDEDAGMLFLFPSTIRGGFWMKDTLIPLTIAYMDENGRISDMKDGVPRDETVLTPAEPYRYVLEMNQGWFARHGFGVGSVLTIPDGFHPE